MASLIVYAILALLTFIIGAVTQVIILLDEHKEKSKTRGTQHYMKKGEYEHV